MEREKKKQIGFHFWNNRWLFSICLFVLTCSISVTSTGLLSYIFFCRFVQVVLYAQSLPRVVLWSSKTFQWRFCVECCTGGNTGASTTTSIKVMNSLLVLPGSSGVVSTVYVYLCSWTIAPYAHLCFSLVKSSAVKEWERSANAGCCG